MDNYCSGKEKSSTVENQVAQFYKESTVPQNLLSCATSEHKLVLCDGCDETVVTGINSKEMSMETTYF